MVTTALDLETAVQTECIPVMKVIYVSKLYKHTKLIRVISGKYLIGQII